MVAGEGMQARQAGSVVAGVQGQRSHFVYCQEAERGECSDM